MTSSIGNLRTKIDKYIREGSKTGPDIIKVNHLRNMVGVMAVLLAFFLVLGNITVGGCCVIQPSISHYYYTNMRDFFVGTLFAVSIFLYSYKGYGKWDNVASTIAATFAFLTAIIPTDYRCSYPCQHYELSFLYFCYHQYFHLAAASTFLLTLSFMSIFLFTQSDQPSDNLPPRKKFRNTIYRVSGYTIAGVMLFLLVYLVSGLDSKYSFPTVFVGEVISLLAFGISWFTKGGVLFPDKKG